MDVLIITVFISLVLVVLAVLFLVKRTRAGDFEHGDRLSLLPLDDEPRPKRPSADSAAGGKSAPRKPAGASLNEHPAPGPGAPDPEEPNRSPSESS